MIMRYRYPHLIIFITMTVVCFMSTPVIQANPIEEIPSTGSAALTIKAWNAFNDQDYESAIEQADECIRRHSAKAVRMQSELTDYPRGSHEEIHRYYALNDVATAHYIKAESLYALSRIDEAVAIYQTILDTYSFGQCWDQRGWFWKPAVAAREKLSMIESGDFFDYGDYRSMTLMVKAWNALDEEDFDGARRTTDKCIQLYETDAQRMQAELHKKPKGSNEYINSFWALNDVATAYFIRGEIFRLRHQMSEAVEAYQVVIDQYPYAQCWDPRGWFWTVADGARGRIQLIEDGVFDE